MVQNLSYLLFSEERIWHHRRMAITQLKCVVCDSDKAEVFVRLVAKGADAVACAGCMPVVIHGARGHHGH